MIISQTIPVGYTVRIANGLYIARHDGDIIGAYPSYKEACDACLRHYRGILPSPPSEIVVED